MISDLEGIIADYETRLTATEENTQGNSKLMHDPRNIKITLR